MASSNVGGTDQYGDRCDMRKNQLLWNIFDLEGLDGSHTGKEDLGLSIVLDGSGRQCLRQDSCQKTDLNTGLREN